jgi:hypothetical protein
MSDALLYRDGNYGALAVIREGVGLVVADHGFDREDKRAALAVLDSLGCQETREDGTALWRPRPGTHLAVLQHTLENALANLGYDRTDPLAERALTRVPRAEALAPDLPTIARHCMRVSETVERGLRRHVDVALAVLRERGDVQSEAVDFFPRPRRTDGMRRPLPFARVRAVVARPIEQPADICASLREALAPVAGSLTRLTVSEVETGRYFVEFAVSPPREAVEALLSEALPTFDATKIRGVRAAKIRLNGLISEEDVTRLAERAAASTAAVAITRMHGRMIVARIPGGIIEGAAADYAFSQRLSWLFKQLAPWDPKIEDVSESEPVLPPAANESLNESTSPTVVPGSYKVKRADGARRTERGFIIGNVFGIEDVAITMGARLMLTHIPTGYGLARVANTSRGIELAVALLKLVEVPWTTKDPSALEPHGAKINAVVKAIK